MCLARQKLPKRILPLGIAESSTSPRSSNMAPATVSPIGPRTRRWSRQIRRVAGRRQVQRPQRAINWRSPQWSRGVPMLQCWHVYYSVIFSRGQRGLQRTAETCGGGGSSGIDDKTRHVGLHVHSFTSEGFVILVLTRVNTSSEIRSFGYPQDSASSWYNTASQKT